jgi:putative ABC transport system permease protein
MLGQLVRTFRLGIRDVSLHKLRSILATVGIVLGVASVIVMLAVGEAARYEAVRQIEELGACNIIVRSVKPTKDTQENADNEQILNYGLTTKDLERLQATIPTVTAATPLREFRKEVRYLDRKLEARVVGVLPSYLRMNSLRMSRGRFLTELDDERFENYCVLGAETAEQLFIMDDPIGQSIRVGESHYYQVIGVTERRAQSAGIGSALSAQDYNRDVYIPFATDKARFGKVLIYERAGTFEAERLEISQITLAVDQTSHVRKTAAIVEDTIKQFHKKADTEITVPLDLIERVEQAQRIFTYVLGAIASISLIVGGIGIMNIMLATVTERTQEIGIRRALGAKRRDITWQFLTETVVLSATGGVLGVGLGIVTSVLVTQFFSQRTILTPWSPALAFTISVAVGIISGTYPARRAALMDPIEALRHE